MSNLTDQVDWEQDTMRIFEPMRGNNRRLNKCYKECHKILWGWWDQDNEVCVTYSKHGGGE